MKSELIGRRTFLGYGSLAAAGLLAGGSFGRCWRRTSRGLPMTAAGGDHGREIRGLVRYGVNQF